MNTFFLLLGAGILDGAILAPACVGFTLQFGVTNYVNFAYGSLLTFAAFMFWTFNTNPSIHLDLWAAALAALMLTALVSALLGGIVYTAYFRRRPQLLYALVLTFAVGLILDSLWKAIWGSELHQVTYPANSSAVHIVGPFLITNLYIVYIAISLASLGAVFALLRYTKLGKTMRAMSDDRSLAMVCGLPVVRTTNSTWALTGFLGGVAGVVLALQSHGFDQTIGGSFIYLVFAAVILGGIGRPYGAALGALIIGLVFQLSTLVVGTALAPVAVFAVLVLMMLLRPEGLFGSTGRSAFSTA